MLPRMNQMTRKGPATQRKQSRHGKHAARVKVAASLAPLDDITLSAKMERKASQATPFTHSHRDRLWLHGRSRKCQPAQIYSHPAAQDGRQQQPLGVEG